MCAFCKELNNLANSFTYTSENRQKLKDVEIYYSHYFTTADHRKIGLKILEEIIEYDKPDDEEDPDLKESLRGIAKEGARSSIIYEKESYFLPEFNDNAFCHELHKALAELLTDIIGSSVDKNLECKIIPYQMMCDDCGTKFFKARKIKSDASDFCNDCSCYNKVIFRLKW